MSLPIEHLPDELLTIVLSSLPKSDLKKARLVNLRWGQLGAPYLFQRIYFAPHPNEEISNLFSNISNKIAFGRSITELVYDGRLFAPAISTSDDRYKWWYQQFLPDTTTRGPLNPDDIATEERQNLFLNESRSLYSALFYRREELQDNGRGLTALVAGIRNMPNLKQVVIRNRHSLEVDPVVRPTDTHRWYRARTTSSFGSNFPPADSNHCDHDAAA